MRAQDTLAALTCPPGLSANPSVLDVPETVDEDWEWNPMKLLPLGLFSANPGLLTAEYVSLASVVKPLFGDCPHVEDVRCLTRDELTTDWVFDSVIEIWKSGLIGVTCSWHGPLPVRL